MDERLIGGRGWVERGEPNSTSVSEQRWDVLSKLLKLFIIFNAFKVDMESKL